MDSYVVALDDLFVFEFEVLRDCNESQFCKMQGALDGGLDIPHSDKRFAGYTKNSQQLDVEVHRKYIFGGHVAAYMRVSLICFFHLQLLPYLVS